jgi:putative MATE family efflux protein
MLHSIYCRQLGFAMGGACRIDRLIRAMANNNPTQTAVFTTGSTLRHVLVMTATASVGLIAIFIVDMLNLFYISLLGVQELAAAVGFASTLMFFTLSISIGLTIPTAALVGRALGQGNRQTAAELAGISMAYMGLISAATTLAIWPFLGELLHLLGARGETLLLAQRFLDIVIPSTPIMALGMCTTGILRGAGDAKRSMYVTLSAGVATAILDPLLIFGLNLGLDGAAISTVLSRFVMLAVGWWGARNVHRLLTMPDGARLRSAAAPFFQIGVPAVLTQLATPVGNAWVTGALARFGDDAVAGMAVIGRLVPVAFVALFALSGAIGPILAQNLGARKWDRLQSTLRDAFLFNAVYVLAVWALMALFSQQIADLFGADALARELIVFFCVFAAGSYLFNGSVFVASAVFNNLGYPRYSTVLNWGRATLGVIPFVSLGAAWYGAIGALAGSAVGVVVFGIIAVVLCYRIVGRIVRDGISAMEMDQALPTVPASANSPFSTGKAATLP